MPEVSKNKIRYLRLNQVFNKALSQSIAKFQNYEKVSSCFPEYSRTHLGKIHLINCQKQVTEFWTQLCNREFQEIMKERGVKEKLDELDTLITEAKLRLNERNATNEESTNENEVSITDLSVKQIIQCNLHTQRKEAFKDLDQRINRVDEMNQKLELELTELEQALNSEYKELNDIYLEYLGQVPKQPLDKTLTQSLNNMLLELKEN